MKKVVHQNSKLITAHGEKLHLAGESVRCPVCQGEKARKVYDFGEFSIVKCVSCNVMHLSPLPTAEGISGIYNTNYFCDPDENHGYRDYGADAELIKRTYLQRFKKIRSAFRENWQPTHIHEIGSALGFGLEAARGCFPRASITCSDISGDAVRACSNKGFASYRADLYARHQPAEAQAIDLLYCFDVVEHLHNVAPFLEWAHALLADQGLLCLTTPDMNGILNKMLGQRSPSIKIPQHVIYFTTETLRMVFAPHFELIEIFIDFQFVSLQSLVSRIQHIFHFPVTYMKKVFKYSLLVPNGMKLYVFQKK